MSTPFLSQIRVVSFQGVPRGHAACNGQLLPINQNQALFSLLGTTYGGNGQTTFALPDLRGRVPFHFGNGVILGQKAGEEAHTLNVQEMPAHTHLVSGSPTDGTETTPSGNVWAIDTVSQIYSTAAPNTTMAPAAIGNTGGSQPHDNMSPYLVLNFVIALQGIFPSQN